MLVITSKDNEFIKNIRKLKDKKYRQENNKFIIEGTKVIEEAINEKANIENIIICEECLKNATLEDKLLYEIAKFKCIYVNKKVFETLTDVTNPQGILAIINKTETKYKINYNEDIILILDDIQDPGNLGTIIRTADSVGLKQIIVSKGTIDECNSKVIRSTMGAIFRVKIVQVEDLKSTINKIKEHKYKIASTCLEANKTIYETKLKKVAIVIGNEANGVSQDILKESDYKIKIPMKGKTESLNAAVATGIILYEYVRQTLI